MRFFGSMFWAVVKDDWGVILAIALPVVTLIWFFVWYETKNDAKVYEEVIPMAEHVDAIRHFEYKGHRYIWVARYNRGGLVHDPDCACHFGGITNLEAKIQRVFFVER